MILSQTQIANSLRSGEIAIAPFNKKNLKEGSYTFTLDTEYLEIVHTGIIDFRSDQPVLKKKKKMQSAGYILAPHSFVLCQTRERLVLNGLYGCFLSGLGSCAQVGLNVLQSSQFAEPTTAQQLILEISNVGHHSVALYAGMRIVKGIFLPVAAAQELRASIAA